MLDLVDQIQSFLLTLLVGMVLGVVIHYYQITIRKGRLKKHLLYALDFFLWITLMALIFVCLVLINLGEMRVYVFIALLGGALAYYRFGARYCSGFLSNCAQATVAVFSRIKDRLAVPVNWGTKKIRHYAGHLFKKKRAGD